MSPARSNLRAVWLLALLPVILSAQVRWNTALRQAPEWYAGTEAQTIAAHVLLWQHTSGGWPKNTDLSLPPTDAQRAERWFAEPTIDNNGTTTPLRFLATVISARPDPVLEAAFLRGFDYLLVSQYENGGWPQFFPLKKGYYTHITYNDNAMVNVLTVLREAVAGKEPFAFVDEARRKQAATAVEKGIACILRTQVKQDGKLTVWCAQHDETTLEPAPARKFEPASLSGGESLGILKFLMAIPDPTPEIIAAIEGAVAWFEEVKLTGIREDRPPNPALAHGHDRVIVADPAATPLWARFYELGTNRPIYTGRDAVIRYNLSEIEAERRGGYSWHSDDPAKVLERDYPRWRAKNKLP